MTRPKDWEGLELSATLPVEMTGEKAGMLAVAVTDWATLPEGMGGDGGNMPSLDWARGSAHTRRVEPSIITRDNYNGVSQTSTPESRASLSVVVSLAGTPSRNTVNSNPVMA